ncbi:MAG: hypothetical protein MH112_10525 [Phenylobacterium sp.]|uniref:hypothetical protein n=1 Tax=Phenylobacterium sp. TaxID=1871053 RepID=UPI0025F269D2|nr:hypothetical protein [Phenylobacterium sp.]MCG9916775.1 hypothetical protein [Phenylobacterium sp.]
MRIWPVPPIITAMAGVLALSACDERPPLPPFTEKAAPAAEALPAAVEAMAPQALGAACCACPSLAAPACPEVAPTQVAATPAAAPSRPPRQRSEQAYAHRPARVQPATYHPVPPPAVDYGDQSHQPVGHHGGYVVQPAPEPVIRDGYVRRHDTYQGTRHTYGHERYAHVSPAPAHSPPPVAVPLIHRSHGAHGGYVSPPQGYAHAGGGGSGPCCAGPSVQAAGRDSAGYLTWSGKRPPAPYY